MKLENKEQAYIPVEKLLDYLLSETHPVGKSKAKYFRSLGFNETNIGSLKQGLLDISASEEVQEVVPSEHGVKYIIDGTIKTPGGITVGIRTIWIIDKGMTHPRFVTAYPI